MTKITKFIGAVAFLLIAVTLLYVFVFKKDGPDHKIGKEVITIGEVIEGKITIEKPIVIRDQTRVPTSKKVPLTRTMEILGNEIEVWGSKHVYVLTKDFLFDEVLHPSQISGERRDSISISPTNDTIIHWKRLRLTINGLPDTANYLGIDADAEKIEGWEWLYSNAEDHAKLHYDTLSIMGYDRWKSNWMYGLEQNLQVSVGAIRDQINTVYGYTHERRFDVIDVAFTFMYQGKEQRRIFRCTDTECHEIRAESSLSG